MAIISRTRKYLFIQSPNTASTAVAAALMSHCDGERFPRQAIQDESGNYLLRTKHCTVGELEEHGVLDKKDLQSLFKFATVRNPFNILVSRWNRAGRLLEEAESDPNHWLLKHPRWLDQRRNMAKLSFPEWAIWRHSGESQTRDHSDDSTFALNFRFADGTDFVMRFEDLATDFQVALRRIGCDEDVVVPQINVGPQRSRDYRSYYSKAARDVVERAYRRELDAFGYSF